MINIKQNLSINTETKIKYGEILTPYYLIDEMLDLIPISVFKNKNLKWLDAGAGSGNFSICLYNKLFTHLNTEITDDIERKDHIIQKMMYMSEIQPSNISILKNIFGNNANIKCENYLTSNANKQYDLIIGNPPYNSDGLKKTPTNTISIKKDDGKTVWNTFIEHSLNILKPNGYLLVIIPSIWMKPTKSNMYDLLISKNLMFLKAFTNTETNKIFKNQAQTPTCYFLLQNKNNTESNLSVKLYDKHVNKYVLYNFVKNEPIPVCCANILNKIRNKFNNNYPKIKVIKTNLPSKKVSISNTKSSIHVYKNIKTTKLTGLDCKLIINYSNEPLSFYGEKKLVLPHKMYGFPYLDISGNYGISNRDNYVILSNDTTYLQNLKKYLSTQFVLYLYESTRYRMKYLEKYVFDILPDMSKILKTNKINDNMIYSFFDLDETERNYITNFHKKKYSFKYV